MENTFTVTAQEGIKWEANIFLPLDIPKHALGDRMEMLSPLRKGFPPPPLPSVGGRGGGLGLSVGIRAGFACRIPQWQLLGTHRRARSLMKQLSQVPTCAHTRPVSQV